MTRQKTIFLGRFPFLRGRRMYVFSLCEAYLNGWGKRVQEFVDKQSIGYKIIIFNKFFYTRITRNVKKNGYGQLMKNISRISNEKLYKFSKSINTIFDLDIVAIPIHLKNHWLTGVVYYPKNCLLNNSKENSESITNNCTYIIIFDSLFNKVKYGRHPCASIIQKYVEGCYRSYVNKRNEINYEINLKKIKIINLVDPYQQNNGYDCGLFMLEFIKQVLISPKTLNRLVEGVSMKNVFPNFSISLKRNFLKNFVYSNVQLKNWKILNEIEEYFLKKKF
uniref:Ubiquitin-like protease family profile domain-containing protein n=1 Tax=Strongyloides stercoralis TaxID=6248 RepID=A0AAF5DRU8_STRER